MRETVNRRMVAEVAKLYYLGGWSQGEIAQLFGISGSKVSRILARGKKTRVIRFVIADDLGANQRLAEQIQEIYGLRKVIVVPSDVNECRTMRLAGNAASEFLNTMFFDGMKIGLSGGETLNEFCNGFHLSVRNCTAVQLSGNLSVFGHDSGRERKTLVRKFAEKCSASCEELDAPILVTNETAWKLLMEKETVKEHFQQFSNLDLAICEVSSVQSDRFAAYQKCFPAEMWLDLPWKSFAADICGHLIDQEGQVQENVVSKCVIAISPEALRSIPLVVGVAVGGDRARAIMAAARGRLIDVLVTDEIAAISICAQSEPHSRDR